MKILQFCKIAKYKKLKIYKNGKIENLQKWKN